MLLLSNILLTVCGDGTGCWRDNESETSGGTLDPAGFWRVQESESWLLEILVVWTSYWKDLIGVFVTGRHQSTSNQSRVARLIYSMWYIQVDTRRSWPASWQTEYLRPAIGMCAHTHISLVLSNPDQLELRNRISLGSCLYECYGWMGASQYTVFPLCVAHINILFYMCVQTWYMHMQACWEYMLSHSTGQTCGYKATAVLQLLDYWI